MYLSHRIHFILKMVIQTLILLELLRSGHANGTAMHTLHKQLLKGYNKDVRPVKRPSDVVYVDLGVLVANVSDFDQKQQVITTSLWLKVSWTDQFLTWNKSEFNLTSTAFSTTKIWLPDIAVLNRVDKGSLVKSNTSVIVTSGGNVSWLLPLRVASTCRLNVADFPFDEQRCNIVFGSWVYMSSHLSLKSHLRRSPLQSQDSGGEWTVVGCSALDKLSFRPQFSAHYSHGIIAIRIKRHSLFYLFNLGMPVSLMLVLTCVGFYVPCESGEKITLGITLFLTETVFLIVVSDFLPPTSDTLPFLSQYFGLTMILQALSTIMNVIVVYSFETRRGGSEVPKWLKKITFGRIGRLILQSHMRKLSLSRQVNPLHETQCETKHEEGQTTKTPTELVVKHELISDPVIQWLDKIHHSASCIQDELHRSENEKEMARKINLEWTMVAIFVDRTCLTMFVMISSASIMAILL